MLQNGLYEDTLIDSSKVRIFNANYACNREPNAIDAGLSYPSLAVNVTLENLKEDTGTPKYIRCDNGTEFIS
ncbi:hypothetical protein DHD08_06560 [Arenibacter sp. H213]|uniref:Integrase core domain-containing protein n=1 Tax=Arenibacter antarcticus TaxID=2040469 RepID=A0ABW5VHQ1_9FLAO|nr:hypothetical protein [Arenibacter sp. H213]MCM4167345.1 hypothetical protein [Arenibacter sp. H213]